MNADGKTFSFRYDAWCGPLLGLLGSGRRFSRVVVGDDDVEVRLGVAFRARIPRASIVGARRHVGRVLGWGAHGWRGRWLVNGSSKGIVVLSLEPSVRGRVLGYPVRAHELSISMEEPEELCAALGLEFEPTETR